MNTNKFHYIVSSAQITLSPSLYTPEQCKRWAEQARAGQDRAKAGLFWTWQSWAWQDSAELVVT